MDLKYMSQFRNILFSNFVSCKYDKRIYKTSFEIDSVDKKNIGFRE